MKKTLIILIALIIISLLNASVMTGDELQENFERSFDLERTFWDGMVKTKIEYSQEDIDVGETIIVTIHFEIDTEKNEQNLKLAIADLATKFLYTTKQGKLESVTEENVVMEKEYLAWDKHAASIIETDPDLVLSNVNPKGSYKVKYRLNRKVKGMCTYSNDHRIPYFYNELPIYLFQESTEYENITDYHNIGSPLRFYIKINPSAIMPNNADIKTRYYERSDFRREKKKQKELINKEKMKEKNMPKLKFEKLDLNKGAGSRFDEAVVLVGDVTDLLVEPEQVHIYTN